MAQVAENKSLMKVFENLFNADGSEIYLKPVGEYIIPNSPVNFYSIIESAKRKGHTAIGFRVDHFSTDANESFGIQVNPKKSRKIDFKENDKIIVLAEN